MGDDCRERLLSKQVQDGEGHPLDLDRDSASSTLSLTFLAFAPLTFSCKFHSFPSTPVETMKSMETVCTGPLCYYPTSHYEHADHLEEFELIKTFISRTSLCKYLWSPTLWSYLLSKTLSFHTHGVSVGCAESLSFTYLSPCIAISPGGHSPAK